MKARLLSINMGLPSWPAMERIEAGIPQRGRTTSNVALQQGSVTEPEFDQVVDRRKW